MNDLFYKSRSEHADLFMLKLVFVHWFIVSAVVGFIFNAYILGFVGGGVLSTITYVSYRLFKGTQNYRYIIALVLLTFSIIMMQQSLGRIEMHFHIFVALSFLVIYKDYKIISLGSIFILTHHLIFNYLQEYNVVIFDTPIIIFNYGCGLDIVLLHGAFVIFEWFVLHKIVKNMDATHSELYRTREALKSVNTNLEGIVELRTMELKEAKNEADKANQMKSEFLANMSHEIRTPMNAIIGFTDLLKKDIKDPTHKNYVKSVQDSSKILLTIINDILDLSKVEAGKLQMEYIPTDVRIIADEIESVFRQKAKTKALHLNIKVDKRVPNILLLDEVRVRQIMFNLISNALKFTIEGFINVIITSSSNQNGHTNLILEVEDSGIGIDKEQQESMFSAFSQHSNQSNKEYGGTGLGLSIVKSLVELMGGTITLKSQRDVGSTFIVTLKDVEISDEAISKLSLKNKKIIFEKATILLVDDIELNRELIKQYLQETPLVILEATDGQEAVDYAKENEIDLVLMDIRMPNKDGYEATKEIKEFKDVPIMALTASVVSTRGTKDNLIFDDFLHKPIESEKLMLSMCNFIKCEITDIETTHDENSSEAENISINKYPKLQELLTRAKNEGDMNLIEEFAHELEKYAKEQKRDDFKNISILILSAVESFDIEECNILLSKFTTL